MRRCDSLPEFSGSKYHLTAVQPQLTRNFTANTEVPRIKSPLLCQLREKMIKDPHFDRYIRPCPNLSHTVRLTGSYELPGPRWVTREVEKHGRTKAATERLLASAQRVRA